MAGLDTSGLGGTMKSHVSELLEVVHCILTDACAKCTDNPLDLRDLLTIRSRVEREGLSFLTITLPTLGKDFDLSLAQEQIDSTLFRSFKKRGKAPALLQGFFSQVFDETGRIYDEPSIEAIEGIRQIAYAFKKLQVPCSPRRVRKALAKFVVSEHCFQVPAATEDISYFRDISRVLWVDVLGSDVDTARLLPKHGPGATAEKLSGNAKFKAVNWHDRLEPYFPLLDYKFANADAYTTMEFKKVAIVDEASEQPVRVIPVPKTLKTPRIIAIEPVCMQYTQQALSAYLVDKLESSDLTAGHVNFRRQRVNRQLAISSSKNGLFCTLDLSSASDRVSNEVAMYMFEHHPDLSGAIQACRTRKAQLPDGSVLELKKFASMGSALCFPVQAMYYYTICIGAILKEHNLPVTYLNVKQASRWVFVYGDDIIVPTYMSGAVTDALQRYYCKVNVRKSFFTGKFRESCGMDAFNGEEVTPTYIRRTIPVNRRESSNIISWTSTSNLFYRKGYWKTSSYLMSKVERLLGKMPVVGDKCAGLGKVSFQPYVSSERWNTSLHRPEVRTYSAASVKKPDKLNGNYALLKSLLRLENPEKEDVEDWMKSENRLATVIDPKHLERTARHGAVALKRRWLQPW